MLIMAVALQLTTELGRYQASDSSWTLRRTDEGICTINKVLENGVTAIFRGEAGHNPTLLLANKAWRSLTSKATVPATVTIDGKPTSGDFFVGDLAGYPYVEIELTWQVLASTLGGVSRMEVATEGRPLAFIPTGEPTSVLALSRCATGSNDPFAKP